MLGSLTISLLHAAIPSHWLPIIAVGRAQRWTRGETLRATVIAGAAHTASTIALGIVIGLAGLTLEHELEEHGALIAPIVLIALGFVFILLDFRKHKHKEIHIEKLSQKSRAAVLSSLVFAMFFSPCLELSVLYVQAHSIGIIAAISLIYLVVTVLGMTTLVYIGMRSVERVRWHFLEHHERAISGAVLVLVGIATLFMGGHSHSH